MCSSLGLFFLCVGCPFCFPLYRMRVVCQGYVVRMWSSVCLTITVMWDLIKQRIRCQLSSPKVVIYFQLDDGHTTETCSYVYISDILTYDSDVA
jgi:hypothetical protein